MYNTKLTNTLLFVVILNATLDKPCLEYSPFE